MNLPKLKVYFFFLKVVLKEWSVHVSDLRDSHPSLNVFTTDQLVLLSGQMAKVVYQDSKLSVEAVMLLRLIGPGKVKIYKYLVLTYKGLHESNYLTSQVYSEQ